MRYSSPYSLTANTPINILEGITGRRSSDIVIRFTSSDAAARLYIQQDGTASAASCVVVLLPGEAFEIEAEDLVNVDPIVSVMSTVTGSLIYF